MVNEKLNNLQRIKRHLVVSQEVYDLIMTDCMEEFRKHHKEMEGAKVSQNHLLKQIGTFYLEQ